MTTYLFASLNRGKCAEAGRWAGKFGVPLKFPHELKAHGAPPTVAELGGTYRANALLKARAMATWSGLPAISDDSGLEIAALAGAPGVETASFGGASTAARARVEYLLELLHDVPDRRARFVCTLTVFRDGGEGPSATGELRGSIAPSLQIGVVVPESLPFSSVFIPEGEVEPLSMLIAEGFEGTHRARALEALFRRLRDGELGGSGVDRLSG